MEEQFTIVTSDDDPEMTEPDLRAVVCRCGWRSVWFGAGTLTSYDGVETAVTADEHVELVVAQLAESARHASH